MDAMIVVFLLAALADELKRLGQELAKTKVELDIRKMFGLRPSTGEQ
jgi:hypothetical protein